MGGRGEGVGGRRKRQGEGPDGGKEWSKERKRGDRRREKEGVR